MLFNFVSFFSLLYLLLHVNMDDQIVSIDSEGNEEFTENANYRTFVNFASFEAGAQIMESSPSFEGCTNLLNDDVDKYGIAPCNEKKYVVIGLSEDIMMRTIILSTFEKYSSNVKEFQVLGSIEYPSTTWTDYGSFLAINSKGEQVFHLSKSFLTRFIKLRFLTHFGSEFYCTLTQVKVNGDTIIQDLRQAVKQSEASVMLNAEIIQREFEENKLIVVDVEVDEIEQEDDVDVDVTGNDDVVDLMILAQEDGEEVEQEEDDDDVQLSTPIIDEHVVSDLSIEVPIAPVINPVHEEQEVVLPNEQAPLEEQEEDLHADEVVTPAPPIIIVEPASKSPSSSSDTAISCQNLISLSEFREKMTKLLKSSLSSDQLEVKDDSSIFRAIIAKVASLELSLTVHEHYINYLKKCIEEELYHHDDVT